MKPYHVLIAGDSGSGKTTDLRDRHDNAPASVWLNHTGESDVSGKRVSGLQAMKSSDRSTMNYVCESSEERLIEACEDIRRFAIEYREATGSGLQVILDECQTVLGEDKMPEQHPLAWMIKQGRDVGIKVVLSTQDPQSLKPNYTYLKQFPFFVFIGIPGPFHRGFADYFSLPKSDMPTETHQFVTFGKEKPFEWTVQYRGETNEHYA